MQLWLDQFLCRIFQSHVCCKQQIAPTDIFHLMNVCSFQTNTVLCDQGQSLCYLFAVYWVLVIFHFCLIFCYIKIIGKGNITLKLLAATIPYPRWLLMSVPLDVVLTFICFLKAMSKKSQFSLVALVDKQLIKYGIWSTYNCCRFFFVKAARVYLFQTAVS